MKSALTLFTILILNTTAFSQTVIVKKVWLDNAIEELRTKDIWQERLALQDSLITGLESEVKNWQQQTILANKYVQSYRTEAGQWKTIALNNEKLWRTDRAKKRKKGWVNVLLTVAVGGISYLYVTK